MGFSFCWIPVFDPPVRCWRHRRDVFFCRIGQENTFLNDNPIGRIAPDLSVRAYEQTQQMELAKCEAAENKARAARLG
jgi:hypothetical protein